MSIHQLDPSAAAIDAAIERALSKAPVALRALLIAGQDGGGDIGVRRLSMRIVSELQGWEFGAGWKSARVTSQGPIDEIFTDAILTTGGRVIADMATGGNRARGLVSIAISQHLATKAIDMLRRLEAAE